MAAVSSRQHKQQQQEQFDSYYHLIKHQQTDPVTLYLESLAPTGRRSITSLLVSATQIIGFKGDLQTMPWHLVEYQQLAQIRNTLNQQGKAANTINLTLSALRGVMKACFNLKLIQADQLMMLNDVKPVRGHRLPSGRSLSSSEINKLHRVCQQDKSIAGHRDHALIALMLATGLRRSEVVSLTIHDYNTRTGKLNIQSGKGNKQRVAYLNSDNKQLIRQWRKWRGNDPGSLFNPVNKSNQVINKPLCCQSIYNIIQQRAASAQLGNIRPHDLRRTFVTQLLEAGIDLNTTRQLAGHSDIQTTARYDMRDQKTQRLALKQLRC